LHKEAVVTLGPEPVPVYLFLAKRFKATADITTDYLFQFLFRSYYRLDNAGLGEDFKVGYFQLLQRHRAGPPADVRQLCNELAAYETKKGGRSLQFSFATKLVATLDARQPLYDSFVAALFGFRRPDHLKDPTRRLDKLLAFYDVLADACRWLIQQPQFTGVQAVFAKANPRWAEVPLMKQADLILWATGKAAKKQEGHDGRR
jgi:hypothetical protein